MLRYVVLCLVVVLSDQSDETNLRHPHDAVKRFVALYSIPLQEHCFAEDGFTAASEESSGHIFNSIPPRVPPTVSFQFLLSFAWLSLIDFFLMSLSILPLYQSAMALFPR
jgi:hypothetical protein